MPRYIDASKVTIPEGFFEDLNVPKLLQWLNNQPAADVAPKIVGQWIRKTDDIHDTRYHCSRCGNIVHIAGKKYCDECGAKMI